MGRHSARSRRTKIPSRIAVRARALARRAGVVAKRGSSARCSEFDRLQEARQLTGLVVQRHQEPSTVATAIVIGERVGRLGARRPVRDVLAEQPVLHKAAIRPQAVLQQRGLRDAAQPRSLAAIERRHDGGIEGRRGGMVAHARHGAGRLRLGGGPHHVHQAGAGPVGGRVEACAGRLLAGLAIGRDRAVDEPRVDREQVSGGNLQALAHRQGEVGDEDVGRADQAVQNAKPLGVLEIDRQALLVAGRQLPPVVRDLAGDRRRRPPRITGLRRLDLDYPGAEVREDRCRRRTGDPARAIDDLQTRKYSISHPALPLLREQSCHSWPAHGSLELGRDPLLISQVGAGGACCRFRDRERR